MESASPRGGRRNGVLTSLKAPAAMTAQDYLQLSRPPATEPSLSAELRSRTARLHRQIESVLGLPGAIRPRDDYIVLLDRFLGLYEPLERALAGFPEWGTLGLAPASRNHSACLAD